MVTRRLATAVVAALACAAAAASANGAQPPSWAAPEITAVTQVGIMGSSPAAFSPQAPLTQAALASAIQAANTLQHPTVTFVSTIGPAALYRALSPSLPVTVRQLDAAIVAYLGLGGAAREIQQTLKRAGLNPPGNTGTEAVARMLGLRLNHPAAQDALELLPDQPATRAEAAYSLAHLLRLDDAAVAGVQQAADAFALPTLTPWQQRILTTAVSYVGYPYVWGGTSPGPETNFGVASAGGFDCSGFVWRVYKLTPYAGEGTLAATLRGRTTYQMSGEVPRAQRITAAALQPADVLFFGGHGSRSLPAEVDHAALYLGGGWFVQSSDHGVTLLPLDGWYARSFAWARRPLREAAVA